MFRRKRTTNRKREPLSEDDMLQLIDRYALLPHPEDGSYRKVYRLQQTVSLLRHRPCGRQ